MCLPLAFHAIVAQLGVRTDELAMTGDSGVDATTGKNAGAHHVVSHPGALLLLLG